MKISLKKVLIVGFAVAALAAFNSGCSLKRESVRDIIAKMEVVEVDHRGYVRYHGDVIKPGEFAQRIRERKDLVKDKPVLLSVNPEVYTNQPEIVPYIRRVLESLNTGEIYTKVPLEL